jgi:hydroxymethylbilane synthase
MRLGTRGSALALAQARWVAGLLEAQLAEVHPPAPGRRPSTAVEVVTITTSGDRGEASSGAADVEHAHGETDKSRWVLELEAALLAGDIDLAVHSAKDVPGELGEGLALLGAPARAGVEDVLCGATGLEALPVGARVGTGSVRRAAQLLSVREDLRVVAVGGNVDTRLRRLEEGACDALVLAHAGLQRLGREGEVGAVLDPTRFVPSPGQGTLALQGRAADGAVRAAVEAITDKEVMACLLAERAVARALEASCHTPLGAWARPAGCGCLELRTWVGLSDGSEWVSDGLAGGFYEPEALGRRAAERLLLAGAGELLRSLEEIPLVRHEGADDPAGWVAEQRHSDPRRFG